MQLSLFVVLGIVSWPAALVIEGCGSCSGACASAEPTIVQSDTPSPIVRIVADPPCVADVATTGGGVQIKVTLRQPLEAGPPDCAIFEWLADGSELRAQASFSLGDGPCCQYAYSNGSISPFVPVTQP